MNAPSKANSPSRRVSGLRAVSLVLILGVAGLGLYDCRTMMCFFKGKKSEDCVRAAIKDAQGLYRMAKAAARAMKAITPSDEYYLGRAVAVSIMARHQYRYLEYQGFRGKTVNPGLTAYLFKIGNLLVAAAERAPAKGDRARPLNGYRFVVLNSPVANAYAAPGGYIFVTTGMLKLARNEDQVAAILAHELAHCIRGHGIRAIKKARWGAVKKIFFSEVTAGVFGDYSSMTAFLNSAVSDIMSGLNAGYSRKMEHEADWRATGLLRTAGYNPWGLHRVLRAMERHGARRASKGIYATHPPPAVRLKKVHPLVKGIVYPAAPSLRAERFKMNMEIVYNPPAPVQPPGDGRPGDGDGRPGDGDRRPDNRGGGDDGRGGGGDDGGRGQLQRPVPAPAAGAIARRASALGAVAIGPQQ